MGLSQTGCFILRPPVACVPCQGPWREGEGQRCYGSLAPVEAGLTANASVSVVEDGAEHP